MAEVIIDPEVPARARRELEEAPLSSLLGFSDPTADAARRGTSRTSGTSGKRGTGGKNSQDNRPPRTLPVTLMAGGAIGVVILLILAIISDSGPFFASLVVASIIVGLTAIAGGALYPVNKAGKSGAPKHLTRRRRNAVALYHRRYVVPELDLHGEAKLFWERTSRAARTIRRSEAVRDGLIDSVEVEAVLPYHLWDIAERLALLSAPERRRSSIMRHLDENDPDVRAVLEPQQRTRDLAVADVEQRVGRLEEFAALAVKADTARKRQLAIAELAELNPDYEELLTRLGDTENALSSSTYSADELRAVADDADEAVRLANEAGRSLILPDRDPS